MPSGLVLMMSWARASSASLAQTRVHCSGTEGQHLYTKGVASSSRFTSKEPASFISSVSSFFLMSDLEVLRNSSEKIH